MIRKVAKRIKRQFVAPIYLRIKGISQSIMLSKEPPILIEHALSGEATPVSNYWNIHTVAPKIHRSAKESIEYNTWIDKEYPLYHDFMKLYDGYDNQVVLEYGCGPANDLVGFLHYSKAKKVIGMDVSETGLRIASHRLALHDFDLERIRLILISESVADIPLEDQSVDYIHSQGVLHHTSNEKDILKELYRILKPGKEARVMVYNYYSVFTHLWVAYRRMILDDAFPNMTLDQAFTKSTDGENCPISRNNRPEEYIARCNAAGFETEYLGGYFNENELIWLDNLKDQAIADERLAPVHRQFLSDLTYDDNGYPLYEGKHAGVGGVYVLRKA